ncbi:hypothetical protein LXD69_04860 [Flavobacterium sediminilitoris]|uniref:Lipoprotein n=1 Tax=Flavobacterium sediminilitoris TaxID=2024526 RepID=A0ABY4HPM8_9FLAO|nr:MULTISPECIES: hypothetical protein [Flavobacterium]UOX34842.1 hypothetical protein LXD69_04860 [Flavobacterium sediminilitoris]
MNLIIKKSILLFSILILYSCNKKNDVKTEISTPELYLSIKNDEKLITELKSKVYTGDTIAYYKLRDIYFNSGYAKEFLYYSIFMAENYNYSVAFRDNFKAFSEISVTKESDAINKISNYYLLKSFESKAKRIDYEEEFEMRFGNIENIPSSKDYIESTKK